MDVQVVMRLTDFVLLASAIETTLRHAAVIQCNSTNTSDRSCQLSLDVSKLPCNMFLAPRLRSTLTTPLAAQIRPAHRALHLAPPWLLDDYIPRYHLISSIEASKKRSQAYAHLSNCNLCPRLCGVNRYEKTGVCLIGAEKVKVNTVAPHFGEGMQRKRSIARTQNSSV